MTYLVSSFFPLLGASAFLAAGFLAEGFLAALFAADFLASGFFASGFFSAAFFPEKAGLVMVSLYVLGLLVGILTAFIMKHSLFRGKAVPFVMELPNYRLPIANNVLRLLWDKAKDFLQRAFTVIFLASIIIWFLRTFDFHLNMIQEGMENQSILAQIANMIAPVFSPMGYGDWRVVSALVSGVLAKEVVVAVMSSLFNGIAIAEVMSAATAYALLVFCLLYTPCMAAMATIRRELGTKWMFFIMIFQCVIAWIVSFLISTIL